MTSISFWLKLKKANTFQQRKTYQCYLFQVTFHFDLIRLLCSRWSTLSRSATRLSHSLRNRSWLASLTSLPSRTGSEWGLLPPGPHTHPLRTHLGQRTLASTTSSTSSSSTASSRSVYSHFCCCLEDKAG